MSVVSLPTLVRSSARARLVAVLDRSPPKPSLRRTRVRRARTAVLLALLLFAGIQVGTNAAIRAEWSPIRDPLYFDKLTLFRKNRPAFFTDTASTPPVRVLLIGSSRTQNAVDAGALQNALTAQLGREAQAFNFALAGCGPVTNAVYLRRLAEDGVKPDFVLLEVHPVFLAGQRPDPPEGRWLVPIRLRSDELPLVRGMGFSAPTPAAHGWRGWLAGWYEYRFLLVDRYASSLSVAPKLNAGHEPDEHGFVRGREVASPERAVLEELTRRQYADYFPGFRPDGPGTAATRDMLEFCKERGWKAAIFLSPESVAFRKWYPAEGRQELDVLLHSLAAEYGAPLIDTRAWLPDAQIGDGHHLCGSGADALTARLAREGLGPWMAANRLPTPRTP